ncbi:MAG: hypothetical protein ACRETY_02650 [Steroidobacteraceae bacterium]
MKSGILAAFLLAAVSPIANGSGNAGRIEGVWLANVTLTNCATGEPLPFPGAMFDAMAMFAAGGTFHDTNMNPSLVRSSGFGTWQHVRDRVYRFAFRLFNLDSTGTLPTGSTIVRHRVVLSPDGKSYRSQGMAEFYDVSGVRMLPDGCSKSTATRFK